MCYREEMISPAASTRSSLSMLELSSSSCNSASPCSVLDLSARRTSRMCFFGTFLILPVARLDSGEFSWRYYYTSIMNTSTHIIKHTLYQRPGLLVLLLRTVAKIKPRARLSSVTRDSSSRVRSNFVLLYIA